MLRYLDSDPSLNLMLWNLVKDYHKSTDDIYYGIIDFRTWNYVSLISDNKYMRSIIKLIRDTKDLLICTGYDAIFIVVKIEKEPTKSQVEDMLSKKLLKVDFYFKTKNKDSEDSIIMVLFSNMKEFILALTEDSQNFIISPSFIVHKHG